MRVPLPRHRLARVALGAAARELARERYAWPDVAARLAGIYELVAGRGAAAPARVRAV